MPAMAVESGPGRRRHRRRARRPRSSALDNLISFDMGGTTAKASLIERGEIKTTSEYEVGGDGHVRRWLHGTGHPIRVPVIDLAEVSAGGGSIAWIDPAGALRVGPAQRGRGARARPATGTAASEPTVTDADLVLGYLNPVALLGGALPVHLDRARAAIETRDRPARSGLERARGGRRHRGRRRTRAWPPPSASCPSSAATTRASSPWWPSAAPGPSTPRGWPRSSEIRQVIVPPIPGGFSALGLVASDLRRDYVRTFYAPLDGARAPEARARRARPWRRPPRACWTAPACRPSAARSAAPPTSATAGRPTS